MPDTQVYTQQYQLAKTFVYGVLHNKEHVMHIDDTADWDALLDNLPPLEPAFSRKSPDEQTQSLLKSLVIVVKDAAPREVYFGAVLRHSSNKKQVYVDCGSIGVLTVHAPRPQQSHNMYVLCKPKLPLSFHVDCTPHTLSNGRIPCFMHVGDADNRYQFATLVLKRAPQHKKLCEHLVKLHAQSTSPAIDLLLKENAKVLPFFICGDVSYANYEMMCAASISGTAKWHVTGLCRWWHVATLLQRGNLTSADKYSNGDTLQNKMARYSKNLAEVIPELMRVICNLSALHYKEERERASQAMQAKLPEEDVEAEDAVSRASTGYNAEMNATWFCVPKRMSKHYSSQSLGKLDLQSGAWKTLTSAYEWDANNKIKQMQPTWFQPDDKKRRDFYSDNFQCNYYKEASCAPDVSPIEQDYLYIRCNDFKLLASNDHMSDTAVDLNNANRQSIMGVEVHHVLDMVAIGVQLQINAAKGPVKCELVARFNEDLQPENQEAVRRALHSNWHKNVFDRLCTSLLDEHANTEMNAIRLFATNALHALETTIRDAHAINATEIVNCYSEVPVVYPHGFFYDASESRSAVPSFYSTYIDAVLRVKCANEELKVVLVEYKTMLEAKPDNLGTDTQNVSAKRQVVTNALLYEMCSGIKVDYVVVIRSTRADEKVMELALKAVSKNGDRANLLGSKLHRSTVNLLDMQQPVNREMLQSIITRMQTRMLGNGYSNVYVDRNLIVPDLNKLVQFQYNTANAKQLLFMNKVLPYSAAAHFSRNYIANHDSLELKDMQEAADNNCLHLRPFCREQHVPGIKYSKNTPRTVAWRTCFTRTNNMLAVIKQTTSRQWKEQHRRAFSASKEHSECRQKLNLALACKKAHVTRGNLTLSLHTCNSIAVHATPPLKTDEKYTKKLKEFNRKLDKETDERDMAHEVNVCNYLGMDDRSVSTQFNVALIREMILNVNVQGLVPMYMPNATNTALCDRPSCLFVLNENDANNIDCADPETRAGEVDEEKASTKVDFMLQDGKVHTDLGEQEYHKTYTEPTKHVIAHWWYTPLPSCFLAGQVVAKTKKMYDVLYYSDGQTVMHRLNKSDYGVYWVTLKFKV